MVLAALIPGVLVGYLAAAIALIMGQSFGMAALVLMSGGLGVTLLIALALTFASALRVERGAAAEQSA